MFKFNNSIVPNKVRIGWHFSSNKYPYWDAYSALKSKTVIYYSGHFDPVPRVTLIVRFHVY